MNGQRERDRFWARENETCDRREGEREPPSFERLLDRLVDRELTSAEYGVFVKSLDDHPDGWRRCALAFLESQAWSQELSEARPSGRANEPSKARPGSIGYRTAIRWAAIAASWLVALGIGVGGSSFWWGNGSRSAPFVAGQFSKSMPPMVFPTKQVQINRLASSAGLTAPPDPIAGRAGHGNGEVEFVTVGQHDDGPTSSRLPLRSLDQQSSDDEIENHFWSAPAVVELLRRSGHEVHRQQELVPFDLPDGRQLLMPVDKMEVKPVRQPAY